MPNKKIFNILEESLESIKNVKKTCLKPDGGKTLYRPFFCSLSVKDSKRYFIDSLNGSIMAYDHPSRYDSLNGQIEMRMGHPKKGGGVDWGDFLLPGDLNKNMSKQQILETCNDLFWTCADDLEFRYQRTLGEKDNKEKYIYFAKENPVRFIQKH